MNNEQKVQNMHVSQHSSNETLSAAFPVRVQRKRTKGYRMPENTKSVTRPGKYGNPYKIGEHSCWLGRKCENIDDVMKSFRMKMNASKAMQRLAKHYLRGKNLACFCPLDKPCHADILLEFANRYHGC